MNNVKELVAKLQVPILYTNKDECDGCRVCYENCPLEAISMVKDESGKEYPKINEDRCVRCRMCIRICPLKQ